MHKDPSFEPHLVIREIIIQPAAEWTPQLPGWSFIKLTKGFGYWRQPDGTRELANGSVVVLSSEVKGFFRASQLSEIVAHYFSVEPEKLTGLVTLGEQNFFKTAAAQDQLSVRVLPESDPLAEKFRNLCLRKGNHNLAVRFQFLQLFTDLFKKELNDEPSDPPQGLDARERLRQLLKQMPACEFINISLSDLVGKLHCTPRHLSRLFHEEVGISFREKQAEVRLNRARQLLATTNNRVVDVALESGFQSHSLFNLMFKKRFGRSPGQWRERNSKRGHRRQLISRALACITLICALLAALAPEARRSSQALSVCPGRAC